MIPSEVSRVMQRGWNVANYAFPIHFPLYYLWFHYLWFHPPRILGNNTSHALYMECGLFIPRSSGKIVIQFTCILFSVWRECKREYTEALSASNLVWTICTTEMTLQQPTEGSELLHLVHQPSEEQLCEVSLRFSSSNS